MNPSEYELPFMETGGREKKSVKRVFILSRRSLFQQGIETLLSEQTELEIVGQESEPTAAVECIQTFNPDVIILNLDDPEPDLSSPVLCVLRDKSSIRIVGLSLKENKICVFKGEDKRVHQLDDLFNAILD
jgi:DNA-binding NarL/FixJ family response regulator